VSSRRDSSAANVDRICAATFVRHAEFFDSLGSTNDRAKDLARRPELPLPALVVASLQTAGRGRGSNAWWADRGALTFSLLIEPAAFAISTASWPRLSLASAVAVCDALQSEAPHAKLGLKWPNDVMLDAAKVGGILIESLGGAAPGKDRLIVGVGINVNNSWQAAPAEAGTDGVALCDVTGHRHDLEEMLARVLHALAIRFAQLRDEAPELVQAWQQRSVLTGRDVHTELDGRATQGRCLGIAVDGALLLQTPGGERRIFSGTVRLASPR
jgi:BirA family transcriptional regulator, biotin operon repressor / biotin---[acetyl-CoA-carboxylase] ligase